MPTPFKPALALAGLPPMRVGAISVEPAARCVRHADGRSFTLEPRVMQVLVVLAQAEGRVVGRDELLQCCWDGRVVGDAAINRAISRLRLLGAQLGETGWRLDTVSRVGYRLVAPAQAPALPATQATREDLPGDTTPPTPAPPPAPGATTAAPQPPRWRRRLVLGVGAGVTVTLAGLALALRPRDAASELPVRMARDLLRLDTLEAAHDASALLSQRVLERPEDAEAWALLAFAQAVRRNLHVDTPDDPLGQAVRSAARAALSLDRPQPDALLALLMLQPVFRHLDRAEADARAHCRRWPQHAASLSHCGRVLGQGGRWQEAAKLHTGALSLDAWRPADHARLAVAHWSLGQTEAAAQRLDQAIARWPRHRLLWHQRLNFLVLRGDVPGVDAMLQNAHFNPAHGPLPGDLALAAARAIARHDAVARGDTVRLVLQAREDGRVASDHAAPILAALGHPDAALATLRVYYFGGDLVSRRQPAPVSGAFRDTGLLHLPPLRSLQSLAGFTALRAELGLPRV